MVARELAVRLRGSEDVDESVALAGAFNKVTRVVRLTLALDAKLDRDAGRDAAVAARQAEAQAAADPVEARKVRVRGLLKRLLWTESEGEAEDDEMLVEGLNARLDEAALSPDFMDLPIEALARRVIADMVPSGRFALSLGEPKSAPAREPAQADTG